MHPPFAVAFFGNAKPPAIETVKRSFDGLAHIAQPDVQRVPLVPGLLDDADKMVSHGAKMGEAPNIGNGLFRLTLRVHRRNQTVLPDVCNIPGAATRIGDVKPSLCCTLAARARSFAIKSP